MNQTLTDETIEPYPCPIPTEKVLETIKMITQLKGLIKQLQEDEDYLAYELEAINWFDTTKMKKADINGITLSFRKGSEYDKIISAKDFKRKYPTIVQQLGTEELFTKVKTSGSVSFKLITEDTTKKKKKKE